MLAGLGTLRWLCLPGNIPVTDFRQKSNTIGTYSGGTVRDFHPIILFSSPGSSPKLPRNFYPVVLVILAQHSYPVKSNHAQYLPPRGRWPSISEVGRGTREIDFDMVKVRTSTKSEIHIKPKVYRPHSSSVASIGSEEPIGATASPRGKPWRPAAARISFFSSGSRTRKASTAAGWHRANRPQ